MTHLFALLVTVLISIGTSQHASAQEIVVEPRSALVDTPVSIILSGFEPESELTMRAQTTDEAGVLWESHAVFEVAPDGSVDVARQVPLEGTYEGADPMGLFWSMQPEDEEAQPFFAQETLEPQIIALEVTVEGETVAGTEAERLTVAPGVIRSEVREEGLVATLFTPTGDGPHPGIIVLGGSEGGLGDGRAALLASQGYATLALAYFGLEDLPDELVEIPLETFDTGLTWFAAQDAVDAERIALLGASKGAEAALLVASRRPEVRAVVALQPSHVVWQGISFTDVTPRSSWSLAGESIPFVPYAAAPEPFADDPAVMALEPLYRGSLEVYEDDEAFIPVEEIGGPILLISGGDEQLWPSALMVQRILERLEARGFEHSAEHLSYPEAGHLILVPYLPTWGSEAFEDLATGGTPEANAEAAEDSWPRVLEFLEVNLR